MSDHDRFVPDAPPDGYFVQGRDRQRASSVAVMVGRARVELATVAELAALCGYGRVRVIPLHMFQALPTRIADGTLVQGVVDAAGRVDLTQVALVAGGARAEFRDRADIAGCGYAGVPVRPIPSRVYRALPTTPVDGTLLGSDTGIYRVVGDSRHRIAPATARRGTIWAVPAEVLARLPFA